MHINLYLSECLKKEMHSLVTSSEERLKQNAKLHSVKLLMLVLKICLRGGDEGREWRGGEGRDREGRRREGGNVNDLRRMKNSWLLFLAEVKYKQMWRSWSEWKIQLIPFSDEIKERTNTSNQGTKICFVWKKNSLRVRFITVAMNQGQCWSFWQ